MAILNKKNKYTVKNIHLMVTSLCDRKCPYCCNKQYDLSTIPQATYEELRKAENVFLTGGEPFAYSQPDKIAEYLKKKYSNIKKVIVYSNAWEARQYFMFGGTVDFIDGITISIKELDDIYAFDMVRFFLKDRSNCKSNRLYYFKERDIEDLDTTGFEIFKREWQTEFVSAPDSIFRRI